jgi:RNA recognition motif-containing protein
MKLMVLNLPRDFRKQDVAEMFKAYGNIRGCDLVLDEETGKSKGFAFVEMALEHEGEIAIDALHGRQLGKNKIRVKQADER